MEAAEKISKLEAIKSEIKTLNDQKTVLETELAENFKADIDSQLVGKEYGCGTATVKLGRKKIKFAIGKKVSWDQKILREIYSNVLPSWGDPNEYVEVEYNVAEKNYTAWPTPIKSLFTNARTVTPSKPTITIEDMESADA